MSSVSTHWQEEIEKIQRAQSMSELDALELSLLGRKQGALSLAMRELGALSPEEKAAKGKELNEWKKKVEHALTEKRAEFEQSTLSNLAETDPIDSTLSLPQAYAGYGHLHLIPEFIAQVEEVFGRMGFSIAEGPEVETEEYNFSKLNIPKDHPARDMQDTFWVESPAGHVLRTHTSNAQIHYMEHHAPPFRMIGPGKVYRKDSDATHSPMFHQFEGLMVDKNLSLAHMKAVMTEGFKELIGFDIEFRFRTAFFPFVEPGLEVDMRTVSADGSPGKWLEVVGCGMVHPNVLKAGGVDPDVWNGFAFGFGIERLIMIKHGISDLRDFYKGDPRFLGQW